VRALPFNNVVEQTAAGDYDFYHGGLQRPDGLPRGMNHRLSAQSVEGLVFHAYGVFVDFKYASIREE
jgi:hypothetical protein